MNSVCIIKNTMTALERGNKKSKQNVASASSAIPVERSKELGDLPPTQFLHLVVLSDKYRKSAANPQTQNFHVEQKNMFERWPLQSSS